ncbi:P-loop containing nucleoside triphosphate hydrolase protein [Linnemannia elongata AG-77]|uniref:p-loop containing nucleoside triphosphate hydrolase protein n=1 Tax=Linnemannia elongata AG-77 TaxID=1314771 RepID=A0A197K4Y9_9FUNG|nr:P-loop containing nucleoside triphosphate hydrolase protein [Linnemannia elongata AG-77]
MPQPKPSSQSTNTPLLPEGRSQQPSGPGGYGTSTPTSSSNSSTTATPSTSKDTSTSDNGPNKNTSKPSAMSSKNRWSRYAKYIYTEEGAEESPEVHASIWSLMFVAWTTPIFQRGYDHTLQEEDLFAIVPERKTEVQGPRLERLWKEEQERVRRRGKGETPSLLRTLLWFILPTYWSGIVSLLAFDALAKVIPFFLLWVIQYLKDNQSDETPKPSAWYGYGLAIAYLIVCLVQTALTQLWVRSVVGSGSLCRSALIDLIFQKSTRISSKDRLDYPDGTIFNLMSNDATRIDFCLEGLGLLYSVPVTVVVTVGLLVYWMGPSALVGAAVLVFSNPLQTWAMTLLNPIRLQVSKLTDSRMGLVTEVLQGIKVIKFFAYEPSFWKKLADIRLSEIKCISWLLQVRGLIYSTSSSLPVFASALTFVLYAALGNKLDPEIVFPSLAFFTGLRVPLLVLPYCYSDALDGYVSTKRIQKFLLTEDLQPLPPIDNSHDNALSIKDADFYWDQFPSTTVAAALSAEQGATSVVLESTSPSTAPSSSRNSITEESEAGERQPLLSASNTPQESAPKIKPFLRDINLQVPRGSLVAVVGPVGSGKSSLLQAMVGNMMKSQGEVIRGATISYASQMPWIQNATIMDNILFDTPMEEERYWRVIKACSLEHDLTQFMSGDKTEIGERGVNMSGGQKARLSLARSVYYNAEMVIMDDPLSAVDAHVGKRLWEDCVLHELSNKTRVIATHQLHVLPDVDYVVCMKHGRIAEQGTFRELMSHKGDFFKLMKQYGGHHHHDDDDHRPRRRVLKRNKSSTGKVAVTSTAGATVTATTTESDDDLTILQELEEIVSEDDDESTKEIPKGQMTDEERASGAVSRKVYREYFRLGGDWNWVFIVFLLSAQQAAGVAMNVWLSFWSSDRFGWTVWEYINVYMATAVIQLLIVILGSYMLVLAILKGSRVIHDNAFLSVLRSPMSFFDTTPAGRILNRFSKDVSTVDNMAAINSLLITVTGILSVLILSAVFLPWIIPVMVPLSIMYYYIAVYYQKTSRELKRIDALVRSHLFSYFSETLNGMGTLKAYHPHGIDCAIERNRVNMDRSHRVYYIQVLGTKWIGARVHVVGHVLNFVALVLIIWARDDIDPATAGLILSYLARLSSELNWAIQCAADLENNMTSAERLFYYTNSLEQEPPAEILDRKPVMSWPQQGRITFQEVSLRYRPELPLVLDKISFDIQAGHKVGVVGRTGAGKSSLIQALFLLVPLDPGSKIVMDGIETDTIGTADLRSRMSIIPQDPVLFQGTFRYNLDPLNKHTEQELWQALEASDMKGYVQQQEGGLDAVVAAQGENLSVGQRQLVCLSRALLSRSKVVILDEATASVDLATDSLIQKAIRVDFSDSTVITIAHRLNTVIDYNRILVMDRGQVAEYDTPRDLLKDRQSLFSKMVDETGEANAALLRSLAGC